MRRPRPRVWFPALVCVGVLTWAYLSQLAVVGRLWLWSPVAAAPSRSGPSLRSTTLTPLPPPRRIYQSNGYLMVSCNGGLNQMRSAICDMVAIVRLLNLTLVVPELDKKSFWADPSTFGDIFDIDHFIHSLQDEVQIVKRLPKKFAQVDSGSVHHMPPVSWSNEKYYLEQILPLFNKTKVVHFNKTDARLANNGVSLDLQKLRCRVNFHALKYNPRLEALGNKLVKILQNEGYFVALHLRYEMDMLAFSGCTRGCSAEEAEELKRMRYAYRWWREKEIDSEAKRQQGICPLTPEETSLVLKALGFNQDTRIYIAAGEIYGGEKRLKALKAEFPNLVRKETLLPPEDLHQFEKHSSQMAALDVAVSIASDVFIPTYDGNLAKVVEGHRRYLGFRKSLLLDRQKLVPLLDAHQNGSLSWNLFAASVRQVHQGRVAQPSCRAAVPNKPKEEEYFYANPHECLLNSPDCSLQ